MKLQIKPLKGETFEVEFEPSMKTSELKERIAGLKPEYPAAEQKLIASGRILADASPVSEYNIKDGDTIVIMVAKAKAKAAPASAAAAEPAAAAAEAAPAAAGPASAPAAAPGAAPGGAAPAGEGAGPIPAPLLELRNNPRFGELAQMIVRDPQSLVRMLPALDANPRHAHIAQCIRDHPRVFMRMVQETAGGGPAGGGGGGDDPLAALSSNPQFAQLAQMAPQLAQMVQQNPQAFQTMVAQLEQSDPAMAQAIRQNPEAFMRMLQAAGGGGGGGLPPGTQAIRLSEADQAAVQRLQDLGFDRNVAAQAYLACDRNEELAANYLFEHGADEDAG